MNRFTKEIVWLSVFLSSLNIYSQTKFPNTEVELGYDLTDVHARVAMPIDGQSRIWVKGSKEYNTASVVNEENNVLTSINLHPPFFTSTINVNVSELKVKFSTDKGTYKYSKTLYPKNVSKGDEENFSILLYGCMEPFMVEDSMGIPISKVFKGENNSSYRLRELFKNVALGNSMMFRDSVKAGKDFIYNGNMDSTLLRHNPSLVITTGDQVYVDAGYGTSVGGGETHPISAWQTKRRPYPFNTEKSDYIAHLNKLYNASYSFEQIESVHRRLPTISTIDDHELRDGWGSQGDEYDKDGINKKLAPFYHLGKSAFIHHQLALSTYPQDEFKSISDTINSMHYAFKIGNKNGFVLDLRSARNINDESILGEKQWLDFENWLSALSEDQEVIIVTSIPLTLRPLKLFENIMKFFKPELRDDVRDGWSYRKNVAERDKLIRLLTKHRKEKNIKPIFVSGDVHKSALIEIWVDTYADRDGSHDVLETIILGYEVVASGLSHEFIKTGISKSLFKITESQRIGDGFIEFNYEGNNASLYPMVRISKVAQNFGAIEFSNEDKTKIHTFIYDKGEDNLQQYYLELDFEKKLPDNDYYIFNRRPNGKIEQEFISPIPHGMRIIED